MALRRVLRHLLTPAWAVRRVLPPSALQAIQAAIQASEARHRGQVRFAVEHALDLPDLVRGKSAAERALEVFSALRVWDTEENNGVLVYLLLADRDVEIVADRGIHAHVDTTGWAAICRAMEAAFRAGEFERGVIDGIEAISAHLRLRYPGETGVNELPDQPVVL